MPPRLLATALTCGILLTGCGGNDEADAAPSPTPTRATPTPTPTPTVPPEPDRPERPVFDKGKEGQEAFAAYVVEAWAYALASNDPAPLVDLSAGRRPCQGCPELVKELRGRAREGWSVYPFEVTIQSTKLIDSALGVTARVRFDVPETKSFFDDGTFRNTSPAKLGATFTVSMRAEKRAYQLIGFTIAQG